MALFRNLRRAVRPGGRVLVETSHRDLFCASLARMSKTPSRMADGTIFLDEPEFDAVAGIVTLNWYWSGPNGSGEKHATWRCYTPTEIVKLLESAGLRFMAAYEGLSKFPSGQTARRREDDLRSSDCEKSSRLETHPDWRRLTSPDTLFSSTA